MHTILPRLSVSRHLGEISLVICYLRNKVKSVCFGDVIFSLFDFW